SLTNASSASSSVGIVLVTPMLTVTLDQSLFRHLHLFHRLLCVNHLPGNCLYSISTVHTILQHTNLERLLILLQGIVQACCTENRHRQISLHKQNVSLD